MALLWVEGFEKYGGVGSVPSSHGYDVLGMKYSTSNVSSMNLVTGRFGGIALQLADNLSRLATPHLGSPSDTLISGIAFKITAITSDASVLLFQGPGGGESTISITVLASREFRLRNMFVTLQDSTTANIQDDTWYYLELKVTAADSGGTAIVHLDGVEIINFTGDTNFLYERYGSVLLRPYTFSDAMQFDDWYICDDTGSTNNDFLGDCRVEVLTPNSDASGNWTANSGGNLYGMVDAAALDAVDYIHDTVSGNQALFGSNCLSANASTGVVQGVMVTCDTQQSGRFNKYAKMITQNGSGGTIQESGNFPPGTDAPMNSTQIMEVDPDGATWTQNTVNTFRMGVEVS